MKQLKHPRLWEAIRNPDSKDEKLAAELVRAIKEARGEELTFPVDMKHIQRLAALNNAIENWRTNAALESVGFGVLSLRTHAVNLAMDQLLDSVRGAG